MRLTLLPQTPKPVSERENLLGTYSVLPTQRENKAGFPRDPGRIVGPVKDEFSSPSILKKTIFQSASSGLSRKRPVMSEYGHDASHSTPWRARLWTICQSSYRAVQTQGLIW
jgi:hypothetical protein